MSDKDDDLVEVRLLKDSFHQGLYLPGGTRITVHRKKAAWMESVGAIGSGWEPTIKRFRSVKGEED
jgi:hypothetical protein